MEPFAGLIGAILVSILCITAAKLVGTGATVGGHDILNVAIAIHVTAWILQFIGHGLFEGMSPLTPDRPQVKRPPPSLQITSNFLVFYGLSHGTTLKKKGVAVF